MVPMFYGCLDFVRNIFEITYVNSKIGPLNSNLDGNQDIKYNKKFAIFDNRWSKNTVISNIDA
jgi:hypothetical protein